MTATLLHLHRALNDRAAHITQAEQHSQPITNAARLFCLRRHIRNAAKRAGRTDLEKPLEQRAMELIHAGASTAMAAARVIRENLPRTTPRRHA